MKKAKIYTIGFAKKSLEDFVNLIESKDICKVVDVRLKNTSQLAGFAKSKDLQFILERFLGIKYDYKISLAPTGEILSNYKIDKDWDKYTERFNKLIKSRQIENIFSGLIADGNICFLCTEDSPKHCHRRLLAEYFKSKFPEIDIIHLEKSNLKNKFQKSFS